MSHNDTRPHFLRAARALALAAAASGCAPGPTERPIDAGTMADGSVSQDTSEDAVSDGALLVDVSADVDAELPFTSGPIVPPELPESLA